MTNKHVCAEHNFSPSLYGNKPVSFGIDLGSSSVRVGIYDTINTTEIVSTSRSVGFHKNSLKEKDWEYTQSTDEIMNAINECFKELKISSYNVFSGGVSATCSMVISKPNTKTETKNDVIFWMDNTAIKETRYLNEICDKKILETLGGGFIPEMGVPKLLRFINQLACNDEEYVVFDLHRYIAYKLMHEYGYKFTGYMNSPNSNGVGNDGETFGWSNEFYEDILKLPSNIKIGLQEDNASVIDEAISVSCIDCYSSWFATFPYSKSNTLFIAAGTSSCYLYMKDMVEDDAQPSPSVKGIWGPFTGIIDASHPVYEAGSSCSGKLLEHLFYSHKASIKPLKDEILDIEVYLKSWESLNNKSFHWNIKHIFYYGDLDGNRTPYADPEMRGMFIGESSDSSYNDLVKRYLACLEFLAFQSKLLIDEFKKLGPVDQLMITGSQAKNLRLLKLVSLMNDDIKIRIPKGKVDLMGTKGASLMSVYVRNGKSIVDALNSENQNANNDDFLELDLSSNEFKTDDTKLKSLLNIKYKIHIEMAEQQKRYREMVNSATHC